MSRTSFRLNPHSVVCLNARNSLLEAGTISEVNPQPLDSWMNTQPFSQTGQMIVLCCEYLSACCIWLYVIIMSCTSLSMNPHSIVCFNVKELLARSRHHIWSLSDSNGIQTYNHLVHKWTLNHLAKLAKWLSCVVSTYLYGAFGCLLSCHVRVLEWIHAHSVHWGINPPQKHHPFLPNPP